FLRNIFEALIAAQRASVERDQARCQSVIHCRRLPKDPYTEYRVNFLKKAREEGHLLSTLERITWALFVLAQAVNFDTGPVTTTQSLKEPLGEISHARTKRRRQGMAAKAALCSVTICGPRLNALLDGQHSIRSALHIGEGYITAGRGRHRGSESHAPRWL